MIDGGRRAAGVERGAWSGWWGQLGAKGWSTTRVQRTNSKQTKDVWKQVVMISIIFYWSNDSEADEKNSKADE